ncbi:hypothetical protein V7S43_010580 [Phytophthora oleae]|uniref:MULE transposase domain-containing protein n=1 Tax=Phytophthora oleae TaxID=2107226 RepID=A0ABD3FBW5_9STRA
MQITRGKPGVIVLSAQTFNDTVAASFMRLREMTKRRLEMEYASVFKMPFLNLTRDLWTVSTGKKHAIATSMIFIDKDGTFRTLALLVTVFNESHDSAVCRRRPRPHHRAVRHRDRSYGSPCNVGQSPRSLQSVEAS